jgi:hypothetical protein
VNAPAPQTLSCPSCGATHELRNPGVMMIVCEYCSTAIYWDEERIEAAGKQSVLPEGSSRLFRGATGRFHQKRFLVVGRVRYSFGRGFWDEWYLAMDDGAMQWLTEDNHELAVQRRVSYDDPRPGSHYRPGDWITVGETRFVVQEVGQAECIGVEGELPKQIVTGETYAYVDASSPDGRSTLGLEFDEDGAPTAFMGKWLKFSELALDDEGDDW